jgi:hypothetical protein
MISHVYSSYCIISELAMNGVGKLLKTNCTHSVPFQHVMFLQLCEFLNLLMITLTLLQILIHAKFV